MDFTDCAVHLLTVNSKVIENYKITGMVNNLVVLGNH